uniref:Uncharacterized protein n=1 Tax=Myoviridae sp. ctcyQ27 TaxID=2825139 RepID=A0A8S5UFE0_9CAUD|nr:MAG TPA: hypothetical protein [Myoviridae sp. ctcyQ27]
MIIIEGILLIRITYMFILIIGQHVQLRQLS